MTPQQNESIEEFLTANGLAESWRRPSIEAAEYAAAHPNAADWTNHDYEVLDHLATRSA